MTGEYINTGKIQGGGKIKRLIISNLDLLPNIDKLSKINKQSVQIRLIRFNNKRSTVNQMES